MLKVGKMSSQRSRLGALVMGLGALISGDAAASTSDAGRLSMEGPLASLGSGNVVIRMEGDAIYISERGLPFRELALRNTSETAYLKELLRKAGAAESPVSVPVNSFIVANGGGTGDGPAASGMAAQKKPTPKKPRKKKTTK